ncbi:MAG TPA: Ig-like domain-containing protein [Candidatus Aquicultor sp.]
MGAKKVFLVLIALFMCLVVFPGIAIADQLTVNGAFDDNATGWKVTAPTKGIEAVWDKAGYYHTGSLRFSLPGRRSKGEIWTTQRINTRLQSGSKGNIEFAWKKNWSAILPMSQRIYIELIKPDNSAVTVWADATKLNDNTWVTASVNISSYLDQSGIYGVRLGAILENGNARDATAFAWFDDVRFNITSGVNSRPVTAVLNPTGKEMLTGHEYAINGMASDDTGITKVEVAIYRIYDNSWWNGNSWVKYEYWDTASVTANLSVRSVAWSYSWPLPTSDGATYKILARAHDTTGNQELLPARSVVSVDNVGPVGSIFIEDAASYTNHRNVHVSMDILGALQMRFSQDNGHTWTNWERFAQDKTLALSQGDGAKIITAQFVDGCENLYQISDSIVLDTTPPVTRHLYPASNATNIAADSTIGIVFYEDMDPLSFKNDGTEPGSTFYLKQESRWVAATVAYDSKGKSAKLMPKGKLEPGATYEVYINGGIRDASGNPLAANFSWKFSTSGTFAASLKGTVGKDGGIVEDGGHMLSLEIPKGALAADVAITIDELRGSAIPRLNGVTRYSPAYRLMPEKLPFSQTATIKIKYRADEIPDPTNLRLIAYDDQRKTWEVVPNARIDLVNNQIIAPLLQLTTITLAGSGDAEPPQSTFIAPTGATEIGGGMAYLMYGLANDNMNVAKIEVMIRKESENAYWNGKDWQNSETWLGANITSGKNQKDASWAYLWTLPDDRYATYQIRVRATDGNGNKEVNPATITAKLTGN